MIVGLLLGHQRPMMWAPYFILTELYTIVTHEGRLLCANRLFKERFLVYNSDHPTVKSLYHIVDLSCEFEFETARHPSIT